MSTQYPFFVEFTGSPESGKTTTIKTIYERLINEGLKVKYIRESAEIVYENTSIPKSSYEAHLSMRLITITHIIEAKYEDYDVVLVDRGIIDGIFYTVRWFREASDSFLKSVDLIQLLKGLQDIINPDLLFVFKVDAETAIKRKGHEGAIVNVKSMNDFNRLLDDFVKDLKIPLNVIDTSTLAPNVVSEEVFRFILSSVKNERS